MHVQIHIEVSSSVFGKGFELNGYAAMNYCLLHALEAGQHSWKRISRAFGCGQCRSNGLWWCLCGKPEAGHSAGLKGRTFGWAQRPRAQRLDIRSSAPFNGKLKAGDSAGLRGRRFGHEPLSKKELGDQSNSWLPFRASCGEPAPRTLSNRRSETGSVGLPLGQRQVLG